MMMMMLLMLMLMTDDRECHEQPAHCTATLRAQLLPPHVQKLK